MGSLHLVWASSSNARDTLLPLRLVSRCSLGVWSCLVVLHRPSSRVHTGTAIKMSTTRRSANDDADCVTGFSQKPTYTNMLGAQSILVRGSPRSFIHIYTYNLLYMHTNAPPHKMAIFVSIFCARLWPLQAAVWLLGHFAHSPTALWLFYGRMRRVNECGGDVVDCWILVLYG